MDNNEDEPCLVCLHRVTRHTLKNIYLTLSK